MSAATAKKSKASKPYVHTPRVASFTVRTITIKGKKQRIFTPVNKRAQKLARKVGKRTRLTAKDLMPYKNYHKLRSYNEDGKLVAVRV